MTTTTRNTLTTARLEKEAAASAVAAARYRLMVDALLELDSSGTDELANKEAARLSATARELEDDAQFRLELAAQFRLELAEARSHKLNGI